MYKLLYKFWDNLNICGQVGGPAVDTFLCSINVNTYSQGKVWKGSKDARKRAECQLRKSVDSFHSKYPVRLAGPVGAN